MRELTKELIRKGLQLCFGGNVQDGLALLEQAKSEDPGLAIPYALVGDIYMRQGQKFDLSGQPELAGISFSSAVPDLEFARIGQQPEDAGCSVRIL